MGKFEGRVAIVTGAAQGIGKAVADKLAAEGASVVVADLNGAGAEAAAPAGGLGMQVDVSAEADVVAHGGRHARALREARRAGQLTPRSCRSRAWDDIDFAEWRRIMAVNLDGTFLCCHHGHKPMREAGYGRIVNICIATSCSRARPTWPTTSPPRAGCSASPGRWRARSASTASPSTRWRPGLTETEGSMASPHAEAFEFVQMLQCIPRRGVAADIAPSVAFLASEEAGLGHRADAGGRRGHVAQLMPGFPVARAGAILAVADVERSVAFYRDLMGFALDALYDDPPYASLSRAGAAAVARRAGAPGRRPARGERWWRPPDPGRAAVVLVLEVADCLAVHRDLSAAGADMLAPPYSPPWGGHRFFVRDPDGYLVEVEQPA